MGIAAHTTRSRQKSRLMTANGSVEGRDITAHNVKPGEYLQLRGSDFQGRVNPNSEVAIQTGVRTQYESGDGIIFDTSHPDFCAVGWLKEPGANVVVRTTIDGDSDETGDCVKATIDGEKTFTTEVLSPGEAGDYTVDVELIGEESGNVYGEESYTITVEGDDSDLPDSDEDTVDPGDDSDDGGSGSGDGAVNEFLSDFGLGGGGGGVAPTTTISIVGVAITIMAIAILLRG